MLCVSNLFYKYFLVHFYRSFSLLCNNIMIHTPQFYTSIYDVGGGPTLATSIFPIRSGKNTNCSFPYNNLCISCVILVQ